MQIDPRRLVVLLAVHRAGGVTAAAQEERLTASAVSQQISRLESEVGMPLLDRQPTGAVLTRAGRVLLEAAERVEAELTEARRGLAALEGHVVGSVAVGGFRTVIRALLLTLVADLRVREPSLEVSVLEAHGPTALDALRAGDLDLLILEADSPIGQAPPRGTRDVTILDEPWLVVLPSAAPTPTDLADLERATWLGVDPSTAAHAATTRVLRGLAHPAVATHTYADYDVAVAMVAAGLGVALLPALALSPEPPGGVQAVRLPGAGNRRVVARYRTSRTEPRPQVRSVLDEIRRAASGVVLG